MTSAYSINLNFNNTIPVKTDFTFKQGDKGITLNLATTGLDPTGTTAHIVFKRSNGTSVEAELTGQTGPSYSYTILGNEFEIPGVVVADLKLYNGDTQRVSTASFIFLVTGDTMDGVGGGTGGYSDQLEELSQEFSDTLEEYKDAFGDVGAVNPRGAYDSTADYNVLDLVSYQGSSYLCRTACKNKVPTNTTYWQVFASGGGTDDYEDLENKPSINGVELSGNKSTGDLGIEFNDLDDVDMAGVTDGQVPTWDATAQKYKPGTPSGGGGGTNPNLLINGWFTVNQRGSASYSASGYTVDHWRTWAATTTVTVTNDGITITNSAAENYVLTQYIENTALHMLRGKNITLSLMLLDGTIIKASGAVPASGNYSLVAEGTGIKIRFNVASSNQYVDIDVDGTKYIRAVKLEIGSTSTLHLDTAPNYTTELLKCQRYYVRWTASGSTMWLGTGRAGGTSVATIAFAMPTIMRTSPTVSISGSITFLDSSGTYHVVSQASRVVQAGNMLAIDFNITNASTLVVGDTLMLYEAFANDYIEFNAEL